MGWKPKYVLSLLLSATLFATTAGAEPRNLNALLLGKSPHELFPPAAATAAEVRTLPGGATLEIGADAQVERMPSTKLRLGAPGGGATPTHVYRLSRGRVDVTIPEDRTLKVAVLLIGPGGQSAVAQGGHVVAVARPKAISFTAVGHEMLTGKGSRWRKLHPGQTRRFDLEHGLSKEVDQLPAPEFEIGQRLTVAMPGGGFHANVRIKPVSDAKRYQIVLLKKQGSELSLVSHANIATISTALSGREPGEYLVMARALDEFGVEGAVSSPASLRVMGVELPPGATADGQGVLLLPHQRLPLVAAEGLKMTYGTGSYFVDAPKSVGLARSGQTLVRFKDPSGKGEVKLTLTPQIFKALVEIGPRTAHWPQDRVTVKVRLVDGAGRPVDKTSDLQTRVSVNLDPVKVHWKRQGNLMMGSVRPPRGSRGPWVVRVEVENQQGQLIGRDFLEVVESQQSSGQSEGRLARQ